MSYSKKLKFGQAEMLRLLISHILKEKIKYATSSSNEQLNNIKNREKNASLKKTDASLKTDLKTMNK